MCLKPPRKVGYWGGYHKFISSFIMHKRKRINEGGLYEAPNTRNKINEEVREELPGTETFLTDTQGLKLAYEKS